MSRCALVLLLSVSMNAWAGSENAIAVLDIQGTGVSADLLPTLTEVLTVEIAELGLYRVIAGRDIQSMLGFERQKEVLGCTEAACLAEIGGALGVDRIVASHIGMVGSTYVLNIKLINIRATDTEGRVYETVRGEVDDIIDVMRRSVVKLLGTDSKAARALQPAGAAASASSKKKEASPTKPAAPAPATKSSPPAPGSEAEGKLAQAVPPPTVHASTGGRSIGVMPWIFWGVGALALAGGAVSGIQAKDQEKLANDPSAAGSQLAAERAPNIAARANVMYGVGALGIGAGFLWMWLAGDSSAPAHASLAPTAGAGGLGLCVAGRF